jgi:hypothetical protein
VARKTCVYYAFLQCLQSSAALPRLLHPEAIKPAVVLACNLFPLA